mgnify:CR=1 FL=1
MTEFTMALPVLIAFAISVLLGPVVIPYLRKLKMGQTERVDGVQSHLLKAGTPTMGGIIILLAMTITTLFYIKDYPKVLPILFITLGFGLIGFVDDYQKVRQHQNEGLTAKQKFVLQPEKLLRHSHGMEKYAQLQKTNSYGMALTKLVTKFRTEYILL